jgi:hypothetical protein
MCAGVGAKLANRMHTVGVGGQRPPTSASGPEEAGREESAREWPASSFC